MKRHIIALLFVLCIISTSGCVVASDNASRESFQQPPQAEYGVRCWWWWLNGNVTKEAITRDLEEMKAKGFSGAMIFDAGGAEQFGNNRVPNGPTYGTPEWVALYKHALNEGKRLNLELGLSIQSGWNLGGPNVTPDYAAKQLTWSEIQIEGPTAYNEKLPAPYNRKNYYKDICILAYQQKQSENPSSKVTVSSLQKNSPVDNISDGQADTFWVSAGTKPGQGPTEENPEWIQFSFENPVTVTGMHILGRDNYGPKACQVVCQDDGERTSNYTLQNGRNKVTFDPMKGKVFRVLFMDSYDPAFSDKPRNVQVAELILLDQNGERILSSPARKPIKDVNLKSGIRELGMSAPDCRFLLNDHPSVPGEEDVRIDDIKNITANLSVDGTLTWDVPRGKWTVMRIGYTITDAHVSTYSADWKGHVIDYLSEDAFNRYWSEVVDPLLKIAGPMAGTVLKQLETDSWECGGMNWSPDFASDFKKYRGYDPIPYLPVIAGKIIQSREQSNAFLADFRKTLADCVADNHYKVFSENAKKYNMQIQPECSGPHAGPIDGIKNYRYSDIVMSEFWVPSPHRPKPPQRFFVKQAASAAHIYGKKYVAAESFTSIGPHWDDVLWKSQKPSMDHEFCSGLNMIFFHTFTCSPKEMGLPGQEYFAGTHVNPQVTWWDHAAPFMDYINRCHYMTRQGQFVADVLYYYGDHVPNIASLKESDPAKAMPGFDYDTTSENVVLRLKVTDGKVITPGGIQYRLFVLPDHQVLSLDVLEKVNDLLAQGATVLGPKPTRMVSLVGGNDAQKRFHTLSDNLWGTHPAQTGQKKIGKGRLIWGKTARQVLLDDDILLDFEAINAEKSLDYDYIHYTTDKQEIYFVCNQTDQPRSIDCAFRVTGKQPELWNPVTGQTQLAKAFKQSAQRTIIPMQFEPYGSCFVVFDDTIPADRQGDATSNYPDIQPVKTIEGPWKVAFDPKWQAPASIKFDQLTDWTKHANPAIRHYSGKAVYSNTFTMEDSVQGRRYWIDLGKVEDIGIASVKLNGRDLGIVWTKPFRLEITDALHRGPNKLQISVTNSWRNRLVGDRPLPKEQKSTQTNITIRKNWELLESGLLGPVQVLSSE